MRRTDSSPPPPLGGHAFRRLLSQVRAGAGDACEMLCRLYQPHLEEVARHQLPRLVRKLIDPADVLQEVWGAVFSPAVSRQVFRGPENLTRYLDRMVRNKARDFRRRYVQTQRRSLAREVSLESLPEDATERRDPRPDSQQAVEYSEMCAALLSGLTGRPRVIFEVLSAGGDLEEASRQLDVSVSTARRALRLLRRLIRLEGAGGGVSGLTVPAAPPVA